MSNTLGTDTTYKLDMKISITGQTIGRIFTAISM